MNNLTHEFPEFCIDLAKLALTISTFYQHFCNIQPRYPLHRKDLTPRSPSKNLARNQPEEILLKTRLKQVSIASSAIPPELFAASIDTRQNEIVSIGRTRAENPRCSAQKKGNLRRHETLTDRSLQAFLPAIAVRTWDDIAHRYNLEKPLHKAARSTQLTDYQARSFWQWIEPPPDLPICIPQCAASLQKGGAAL